MCGRARRKPKFAPEAVIITTLGPGVKHIASENRTSGPSMSRIDHPFVKGRDNEHTRSGRNYMAGTQVSRAKVSGNSGVS